jgi:hypothetical protein
MEDLTDIRTQNIFRDGKGTDSHSRDMMGVEPSFRSYSMTDLGIVIAVFLIGFILSKLTRSSDKHEVKEINKVFQNLNDEDTKLEKGVKTRYTWVKRL